MTQHQSIGHSNAGGSEYRAPYDLTKNHAVYSRGDVLIWLTWNFLTGQRCMVLTPRVDRINHERITPCVILQDDAWRWAEETGDEGDVAITAAIFCANLGFNPNNIKNVIKIVSIVRDLMGELLALPPMPREGMEVAADLIITNNDTGQEVHREVKDHA
jgi:hypothetical protein